jgi:hypothetical protein
MVHRDCVHRTISNGHYRRDIFRRRIIVGIHPLQRWVPVCWVARDHAKVAPPRAEINSHIAMSVPFDAFATRSCWLLGGKKYRPIQRVWDRLHGDPTTKHSLFFRPREAEVGAKWSSSRQSLTRRDPPTSLDLQESWPSAVIPLRSVGEGTNTLFYFFRGTPTWPHLLLPRSACT